jgi:hypothetical protein
MPSAAPRDSVYSRDRERMLEHLFLARLLREAWSRRRTTLEVLRPEVDVSGYDLVLEHNGIVRHVQLKASKQGSRPAYQRVHVSLAAKPAGCVIWIEFSDLDLEEKMQLRYWYLGGAPTERLNLDGCRVSRRTTHNREGVRPERANIRDVPFGRFRLLRDVSEVYEVLFDNPTRP